MSIEDPKILIAVLQLAGQLGLAGVIFVIWYFTFRQAGQTQKDLVDQTVAATEQMNEMTAEAFQKHVDISEKLLQLLRDEQEYKSTLTGILDRMEYRLSVPTQCPLAMIGVEKLKAVLEAKQ